MVVDRWGNECLREAASLLGASARLDPASGCLAVEFAEDVRVEARPIRGWQLDGPTRLEIRVPVPSADEIIVELIPAHSSWLSRLRDETDLIVGRHSVDRSFTVRTNDAVFAKWWFPPDVLDALEALLQLDDGLMFELDLKNQECVLTAKMGRSGERLAAACKVAAAFALRGRSLTAEWLQLAAVCGGATRDDFVHWRPNECSTISIQRLGWSVYVEARWTKLSDTLPWQLYTVVRAPRPVFRDGFAFIQRSMPKRASPFVNSSFKRVAPEHVELRTRYRVYCEDALLMKNRLAHADLLLNASPVAVFGDADEVEFVIRGFPESIQQIEAVLTFLETEVPGGKVHISGPYR